MTRGRILKRLLRENRRSASRVRAVKEKAWRALAAWDFKTDVVVPVDQTHVVLSRRVFDWLRSQALPLDSR